MSPGCVWVVYGVAISNAVGVSLQGDRTKKRDISLIRHHTSQRILIYKPCSGNPHLMTTPFDMITPLQLHICRLKYAQSYIFIWGNNLTATKVATV